jgi:hypothetical protein
MFPASSKSGGFTVAFPDVCKTPAAPGPIPIPYPNIAQTAKAKQSATKVKLQGKAVTQKSTFSRSAGDEAGGIGGFKSSKVQGEVMALKARLNALNVKLQGLSPQRPQLWQAALEDYAVTASALYTTLNPD